MVREHLHCSSDVCSDYPDMIGLAKSLFPNVIVELNFSRYKDPWKWQVEDQLPEVTDAINKNIESNGGNVCQGIFDF